MTPRVLVCPSDSGKKPASDFGASSAGGILHNNFQNLAVSYMVGLHGAPDLPQQILSGDRHLKVSGIQHCAIVGVTAMALTPNDTPIAWTNLHNATGNLLFSDGSVLTLSSSGLRQAILGAAPPVSGSSPQTHVLVPGYPPTLPE